MRARYWLMMTAFFLAGCRSDADKMAEFCLNFEAAVNTSQDCGSMAQALGNVLDQGSVLYDTQICADTTACLPCRKASLTLLGQCGQDSQMRPILDKMNFSDALRKQDDAPDDSWSFE